MKILVLGANGMLGHAIHRTFSNAGRNVIGTVRSKGILQHESCAGLQYVTDVDAADFASVVAAVQLHKPDVVVNALGVIKQRDDANDHWNLLQVNGAFPQRLQVLGEVENFKLIHFSTDCVFAGTKGKYRESDIPDAKDWYGLSKHLGEAVGKNSLTLRTSIIGRGLALNNSLVDWFLEQKGVTSGYSKAIFSGLPVNEVARILDQKLDDGLLDMSGLYHLSVEPISKYALLKLVKDVWNHTEVEIVKKEDFVIDRSLDSTRFRAQMAYAPPAWPQLIEEMYKFYKG